MIGKMRKQCWRVIVLVLCQLLVFQPALVQQLSAQGQQRGLKVIIVEGAGSRNVVQQIASRPLTVRVDDSANRPVAGVTVVFTSPQTGPSGDFDNESRTVTRTTGPDGLASSGAFHPNGLKGQYQVRVVAQYQGEMATTQIPQTNIAVKTGHGKLIATIAIAAAVAGAALAFRNKDNGSSTPTPTGPTITFGGAAVGAPKQ